MEKVPTFTIAIIGFGPKGLYGLERLLASLHHHHANRPVQIHLFNRSEYFGPGEVYRMDHPDYLLMNYNNRNISMWPDEGQRPIVSHAESMTDWLVRKHHLPADKVDRQYSSRSTVGHYLTDGFEKLLLHCPKNCTIKKIRGDVTDLTRYGDEWFVHVKNFNGTVQSPGPYRQILLTTGHSFPQETSGSDRNIDFIYPVQNKLARITCGQKIAIKGFGLTFIDAALALTEGRGGRFVEDRGALSYQPSGNEPECIYPYSLSGLPMFPRRGTHAGLSNKLLFFPTTYNKNYGPGRTDGKIDFIHELLPLIHQEMIYSYYRVLFKQEEYPLYPDPDFNVIRSQIREFHETHPDRASFTPAQLMTPIQRNQRSQRGILSYLQYITGEAALGEERSALAASAATWRYINPWMPRLYDHGRFKPDAQRLFLHRYAPAFNRLSYGPPVRNMKKIIALAEAGYINFDMLYHSRLSEIPGCREYRLEKPHSQISVQWHADARIPRNVQMRSESGLFYNLLEKGIIRPFINKDNDGSSFKPGCMDLDDQGHPIGENGETNEAITVYGTPTEGITYDNDTLSTSRNNFVNNWAERIAENLVNSEKILS